MQPFTTAQKPSCIIVGIECRTSNAPEAAPVDIPKLWHKFQSENIRDKIPHRASSEVIALYCDYEGDHTKPYTLVIGCPVTSLGKVPEGMVAKTIPAGSYALFRAAGEYPKSVIETWGKIWQTDLKRTYTGDYELYGDKIEVYIAIQPDANQQKFAAVRKWGLPIGQYAITGSGAMGIRNLREIGDIDIIVSPELWKILAAKYGITDHKGVKKVIFPDGIVEALGESSYSEKEGPTIAERIAQAEIIEGLPFELLEHVLYFKRKRGREKDLRDIQIILAAQGL